MRAVTRVLVVAALVLGAGCARTDWIDRTLVTVDVTGNWEGTLPVGVAMGFELKQEGSTVKGSLRFFSVGATGDQSGPIEGTVAGDVFRFKSARGGVEGEMTVNGDEMIGQVSSRLGDSPTSLRRVDPSSRPASPPR